MGREKGRLARGGRAGRMAVSGAGYGADRVLDTAQRQVFRLLWLFLPEPAIARDLRFEHLLASRFLSDAGQQALVFGALVAVARGGGSALEVALVGVAALAPPALFGLYGGTVADTLPKQVGLAGAYASQAVLCFVFAGALGSDLVVLLALIFAVNVLGQVSGPTESSVLPLVATEAELASAASMINLASAAGTAFGTGVLAPVVVRAFGVEEVLYVCGAMLLLAASRVFDLPVVEKGKRIRLPPVQRRFRPAVRWLVRHPAVGTMIIVAVLGGTVNVVLQTLAPRYVQEVLLADAADTAYVFAPSAVAVVAALLLAPRLMDRIGERTVAIFGLLIAALCLFLLGLVGDVASVVDEINPLHAVGLIGIDLSARLRTAGLLAMPLAFGVSLTVTSVQTYINRRVPVGYQGRTFAMQSALRNGSAIVPLLAMGAAASEFGAEKVLLVSPLLLLVVGYALVFASYRFVGLPAPGRLAVLESFWEEPGEAADGEPKAI